jgi:enediyne biosynthesis protein E4
LSRSRTPTLCAALLLAAAAAIDAYQGMAVPKSVQPSSPKIRTGLPPIAVDFRDIAQQSGLTAANLSGSPDAKKYILESTGAGVAIFDYDNDGRMDIFLVNGSTLDGSRTATSRLYRNLGGMRFADVTEKAGLAHSGWGQGVCAADYDNDGARDLFVTYYGHSRLYHNRGDGTFEDVTRRTGLESAAIRWDTGCSFVDYDLDGKLDLVVTGYVDFDPAKVPLPGSDGYCQWKGLPVMCGPRGLPAGRNYLFHNEGGGRFRDVSDASGIGARTGCFGFTVVASDFDEDGYPDLYVACDSTPSLLYHNRKNGTFEEIGVPAGVALNEDGQEQAGMGVAAADYDGDGHVDIVKTNFSDDVPNVYHNNGDGTFTDMVHASGLAAHTKYLGWGILLADLDHDGRKDVIVINGHVYPEVDKAGLPAKYRQPRLLYWNVGDGRFIDLSSKAGPAIADERSSRGAAAGDLDNDGSLEIVVNNLGERPSLLKNYGTRKNWLLVQAVGTACNRDAVGARVSVAVAGRRLSGEVQTGTSYLSQNDPRLHFGLADAPAYDSIEVEWPGGKRERFPGGPANRIVALKQGAGSPN